MGISIAGAVFTIFHFLLIHICFKIKAIWTIPFVWVLVELIKSFIPIFHFPWCLVHMPLAKAPWLVQHAALGTAYLVSVWVMSINLIIYLILRERKKISQLFVPLVVCGLLFVYSLSRWFNVNPGINQLKILAAQLGINVSYMKRDIRQSLIKTLGYSAIELAEENKADLLVFGEGIIDPGINFPPDLPFERSPKIPFLYGTIRKEQGRSYQSSVLHQNNKWTIYDKLRLVAFGEYVPFKKLFSFTTSLGAPKKDISVGLDHKVMKLSDFKFGNMICFESLFCDIAWQQAVKGAQFLVVISQDDWFQGTTFLEHLKLASIYRSIETGLPLVRTTNLGYTFFTNSRGKIISEAPLNEFTPLINMIDVPRESDAFKYAWVFPWIIYGVSLGTGLCYIVKLVKDSMLQSKV